MSLKTFGGIGNQEQSTKYKIKNTRDKLKDIEVKQNQMNKELVKRNTEP